MYDKGVGHTHLWKDWVSTRELPKWAMEGEARAALAAARPPVGVSLGCVPVDDDFNKGGGAPERGSAGYRGTTRSHQKKTNKQSQ